MNGAPVQGTPDLVLGSRDLTVGVAVVAGGVVAAAALSLPDRDGDPTRQALVAGVAYAAAGLIGWVAPRAVTDSFVGFDPADPASVGPFAALAALVVGLLAGLPVYLRARRGLVAPALALWPATALLAYLLLAVGGEIDSLVLFAFGFGPTAIGALVILAGLEVGARRARAEFG